MSEKEKPAAPKQWIDQALKAVKGESPVQLVEDFTAEMTLVAEGLVEDQTRLGREMAALRKSAEEERHNVESQIEVLENSLREYQRDTEAALQKLTKQVETLLKKGETKPQSKGLAALMPKLILLAGIICGSWVLVTILKLFQ